MVVVALVAAAAGEGDGEGLWANAAGVWETQMIEIRVNSFSRIYALTVSPACANLAHLSLFVSFSSAQCVSPSSFFFSSSTSARSPTSTSPLTPSGSTMIGTTAPGWFGVLAQRRLRVADHVSRMLDSASVGGFKVSLSLSLSLYAAEEVEVEVEVEAEGRGIKGKTVYPDLAR